MVGVFFNHESERSPYPQDNGWQNYSWQKYFVGAPHSVVQKAIEYTFPHMIDPVSATGLPVITAALWSDGEYLTSSEPWPSVYAHGGDIIRIHILEPDQAVEACELQHGLSRAQAMLVLDLFNRKMRAGNNTVNLSQNDLSTVFEFGNGIQNECLKLLASIGIMNP